MNELNGKPGYTDREVFIVYTYKQCYLGPLHIFLKNRRRYLDGILLCCSTDVCLYMV